jgi:hypothetical protein
MRRAVYDGVTDFRKAFYIALGALVISTTVALTGAVFSVAHTKNEIRRLTLMIEQMAPPTDLTVFEDLTKQINQFNDQTKKILAEVGDNKNLFEARFDEMKLKLDAVLNRTDKGRR